MSFLYTVPEQYGSISHYVLVRLYICIFLVLFFSNFVCNLLILYYYSIVSCMRIVSGFLTLMLLLNEMNK